MSSNSKPRFPEYRPGQLNKIGFLVSDLVVYNKKTLEPLDFVPKTMADVDNFFDRLQEFLKQYGFEIEASGTREQILERFYRKSMKILFTESEMLEFAAEFQGRDDKPTVDDIKAFQLK